MAKQSSGGRRSRRKDAMRERAAQQKRRQNLKLWGGIATVVLVVIGIVALNVWSNRPVGEEISLRSQGNTHIPDDALKVIDYNSTPPTSGPHYGSIAPWGVYDEPIPYERILHNLEDGGVAIYYQCANGCPELVEQLEAVVTPYINGGEHVVLMPNDPDFVSAAGQNLHEDMGNRVALAAWQRLDKFDEFDAERVRGFIERYEGIDHHQ